MELIFKQDQEKTAVVCCGISDKEYDGDVIIPETYDGLPVVSIRFEAFSRTNISSVHIPRTVRSIGMQAFAYSKNLKKVTFGEASALEKIAPMAFSGCRELIHIRLPDRLHVIEQLAFNNCICEIPDRCVVISPNFERCKVITYEPDLPQRAPVEKDKHGNRFRLNDSGDGYIVEKIIAEGTIINVPERFNDLPVTELGDFAFSSNGEAWKTVIPSTVKKAGYFPFYSCDSMMLVEFKGTVEEWRSMNIYTWFSVCCRDGKAGGD